MMHLVLADSEIELNPFNKKEILDSSLHHSIMRKHGMDARRRGRPDIVHIFLVVAMESILNKMSMLRVYVHTRNNEIIYIDPSTRIIKNYNRFKGLMVKLFEDGAVPVEKPLMFIKKKKLADFLAEIDAIKILFTRKGEYVGISELHEIFDDDIVCIIGGFPHGYFLTRGIEKMVDRVVAIHRTSLTAWSVAMEAIAAYERFKFK